jgi:hypothetical protein
MEESPELKGAMARKFVGLPLPDKHCSTGKAALKRIYLVEGAIYFAYRFFHSHFQGCGLRGWTALISESAGKAKTGDR